MMNVRDIAQRIQHPESIRPEELDELNQLAAKYPYSEIFSLLYLMGLGKTNDVRFEEELFRHSFRIGDRVQLYQLIRSQEKDQAIDENSTESTTLVGALIDTEEAPQPASSESTIIEDPIQVDAKPIIPEQEFVEEKIAPLAQEEVLENSTLESSEDTIADVPNENSTDPVESKDELDDIILQHAVAAGFQLEELSPEELKKLEDRPEIVPIELSRNSTPEIELDAKQSFTSWLSSNKNDIQESKPDQEAIRAVVNAFSEFDPSTSLYGETEKPKKEFFSPIQKAKESLREDGLPVSETLAKIYLAQGNYPKAIAAYQQLSLKYPEKKIFFANLISDLEQKLNIK